MRLTHLHQYFTIDNHPIDSRRPLQMGKNAVVDKTSASTEVQDSAVLL